MQWYFVLLIALAALLAGVAAGYLWRRKVSEAKIGSAEAQAMKIVDDAMKQAETKKKEALLEAKEEIIRQRNDAESELKDRRREVTHQEHRIAQKEEAIDRKVEALEKKEAVLADKIAAADARQQELDTRLTEQTAALERIAGMSADEAKNELLARKTSEIEHETAKKLSASLRCRMISSLASSRASFFLVSACFMASSTIFIACVSAEPIFASETLRRHR